VPSAMKIANRMVLTLQGEAPSKAKSVQFGAMADDRISIVEKDVAELKEKFGNMDTTLKKGFSSIEAKMESMFKGWPNERATSRERYEKHRDNRSPSRDANSRARDNDRRSPSWGRRESRDRSPGQGYYMDQGSRRDNSRGRDYGYRDGRGQYDRGRSPSRDNYNRARSSNYNQRQSNYYDYRDRNDRRRDERRRESQERRTQNRDRDRDRGQGRDPYRDRDQERGRDRNRDRGGSNDYRARDRRSSSRRSGDSFASAKTDDSDEEERLMERLLQLRLSKN
jgi:hypothetical protein